MAAAAHKATVCEINRRLGSSKGEDDRAAQDEYRRYLGQVYPIVPLSQGFPIESCPFIDVQGNFSVAPLASSSPAGQGCEAQAVTSTLSNVLSKVANLLRFNTISAKVENEPKTFEGLAWHRHREELAVAVDDSRILLFRFFTKPYAPKYLVHELQRSIAALAWRPNCSSDLAVACRNGVCLWKINPAKEGSKTEPSGLVEAEMRFFPMAKVGGVTALSWSPCGRLLASASRGSGGVIIWDVALGVSTSLSSDSNGSVLLEWSPTGDHLLCAKRGGRFYVWETRTWNYWGSIGPPMLSAQWAPDGRAILAVFEERNTLTEIPVSATSDSGAVEIDFEFPGLRDMLSEPVTDRGEGGGQTSVSPEVEGAASNGSGERLVVACNGKLVLYDMSFAPILQLAKIGLLNGPKPESKPRAFSFYSNISRGTLLAVKWSTGECCVYPLIFH